MEFGVEWYRIFNSCSQNPFSTLDHTSTLPGVLCFVFPRQPLPKWESEKRAVRKCIPRHENPMPGREPRQSRLYDKQLLGCVRLKHVGSHSVPCLVAAGRGLTNWTTVQQTAAQITDCVPVCFVFLCTAVGLCRLCLDHAIAHAILTQCSERKPKTTLKRRRIREKEKKRTPNV